MHILKQTFLIIIGSLLINANYAQCPIGETEITIQFIEEGDYPSEVQWDYKIGEELSGSGPYTITDVITTCVPLGYLTIVGCDTAGDTWNEAIFQVTLSNDTTSTTCPIQNGCYLYTSTIEDAGKIPQCYINPAYEVAKINIGTCEGTPVIISGCTNPLATNYSECAIVDDGSCKVVTENNDCSNPKFIDVDNNFAFTNDTLSLKYNSVNIDPNCSAALQDAFYQFVVPQNGKVLFSTNQNVGISLYESCDETSIYCKGKNHSDVEIEDLTPLDTLILQIFDSNAQEDILFSLNEVAPTFNDNCADAALIDVASAGECDLNLINLNFNTLQSEPDCETDVFADAYYQFVVPNSGSIRYYDPDAYTHGFSLFNSCNDSLIVCEDYVYEKVVSGLAPGETLILQIFSWYESDFLSFCIEEVIPSANNNCLNAQPIEEPECDESILYDAFYEFVVPPTGNILFACNYTVGISIYNSCDNASLYCNSNLDYGVIGELPVGEKLILQIFEDSKNSIDLNFCVQEVTPADNNNCSNAELITVAEIGNCETQQVSVSNLPYNSPNIQPDCDYEILFDVYYKFVVPPSEQILFSSDDEVGIAFYSTCNNSSIVCYDNASLALITDYHLLMIIVWMLCPLQ